MIAHPHVDKPMNRMGSRPQRCVPWQWASRVWCSRNNASRRLCNTVVNSLRPTNAGFRNEPCRSSATASYWRVIAAAATVDLWCYSNLTVLALCKSLQACIRCFSNLYSLFQQDLLCVHMMIIPKKHGVFKNGLWGVLTDLWSTRVHFQ